MKPTPVLSPSSLLRGALALAAIALAPAAAFASTAANTVISNVASVSYQDAGGNAQTPVTATATVTVTLVPSAVAISSPPDVTIAQGTSATLSYTVTATANGPDTYNLTSSVTPSNITSGAAPTFPASIALGGTTLASVANNGDTAITVPYDNNPVVTNVNTIVVGAHVVINANEYVVASITKNAAANTASIGLTAAITGGTVAAGSIVGERRIFTETVSSGTVTTGNSGSESVSTTATSITGTKPAATQATPTVITVNRPSLTVTKFVSTDNGATFNATGTAAPGTTLIYKITATNTGVTPAQQVTFTDVVPAYLTYLPNSGKVATSNATTYAAATAVTATDGYSFASGTVSYIPPGPTGTITGTIAGGSVLVLFFEATIN